MSNIHEANDHLSMLNIVKDLTRRIEAIEQRQAKLAVEQVQTGDDETADWDTLANMLGMETVAWMVGFVGEINMYGFENDDRAERNLKAMLIGLACEECNGIMWYEDRLWHWECKLLEDKWDWANSRPAAAIAMLNAYREDE
jgi:hypothetical protein